MVDALPGQLASLHLSSQPEASVDDDWFEVAASAIAFILPDAKVEPHSFFQFVDSLPDADLSKIFERLRPLRYRTQRAFADAFGTHSSNIGTKAFGAELI